MQDGGPGRQGKVLSFAVARVTLKSLNAHVRWDSGHTVSYYWGNYQGRYDLQVYI